MASEIERKFLVEGEEWKKGNTGTLYRQGYITTDLTHAIRVRIAGQQAFLTLKKYVTSRERMEFEYEIPLEDANILLEEFCHHPLIEKRRFRVLYEGHTWEVDLFFGENEGLILAEIELEEPDESFARPLWLGEEVTDDPRFLNANLVNHPFCSWDESD